MKFEKECAKSYRLTKDEKYRINNIADTYQLSEEERSLLDNIVETFCRNKVEWNELPFDVEVFISKFALICHQMSQKGWYDDVTSYWNGRRPASV